MLYKFISSSSSSCYLSLLITYLFHFLLLISSSWVSSSSPSSCYLSLPLGFPLPPPLLITYLFLLVLVFLFLPLFLLQLLGVGGVLAVALSPGLENKEQK